MPNRPSIPAEVARKILVESGYRCAVCGAGLPLERAHIVPWRRSREHRAEDLISLCANCHQRADLEEWGERTLREFKQEPWVLRQHRMPEHLGTVELTIKLKVEQFDGNSPRLLQYALAGFLQIQPDDVKISSRRIV
jgi:type I restriction enzyme R subunit